MISRLKERPWLNGMLAVLCIAAIVVAYTSVGQASPSSAQGERTATVQQGVVQSTVSGSGNIEPSSELNLGFKTSGTVTHIYVKQGQHVNQGQLLATLDPQTAEVTLEQAKASLQSAEANVTKAEEGETSSQGSGTSGTATTAAVTASAATSTQDIALDTASAAATTPQTKTTTTAPTAATPTTSTPTTGTTPTTTTQKTTTAPKTTTTQKTQTAPSSGTSGGASSGTSSGGSTQSSSGSSSSGSSGATVSPATQEASIASAKATVKSDQLTVQSDEQAVQDTKLYAPEDGTIATLSGEVGETVSATGTSKASSATGSSSSTAGGSSSAGSTGAAGGSSGASTGASSTSSGSSSSAATPFIVLTNLSSMQVVVPLSESEVGSVKVGQTATVAIEALSGRKVAAHVLSIASLPASSSSGVVSYDVTFQLDQLETGVKAGMSATAEVVVKQAEGLNIPTSAISAGSVTVKQGGKHVIRAVTTGLAGNSSTIILSGLKAGEQVVLPTATTTGTGASSKATTPRVGGFGGGLGGGGLGGGGGGFAGGARPGG